MHINLFTILKQHMYLFQKNFKKPTKSIKKHSNASNVTRKPKRGKDELKQPKKKVDKSDPNWKLKPNEKITVLTKVIALGSMLFYKQLIGLLINLFEFFK